MVDASGISSWHCAQTRGFHSTRCKTNLTGMTDRSNAMICILCTSHRSGAITATACEAITATASEAITPIACEATACEATACEAITATACAATAGEATALSRPPLAVRVLGYSAAALYSRRGVNTRGRLHACAQKGQMSHTHTHTHATVCMLHVQTDIRHARHLQTPMLLFKADARCCQREREAHMCTCTCVYASLCRLRSGRPLHVTSLARI